MPGTLRGAMVMVAEKVEKMLSLTAPSLPYGFIQGLVSRKSLDLMEQEL